MTAPPNDTTTDFHAVIAALRVERDAALAREAALAGELAAHAAALAQRNTEYSERIEQQAGTVGDAEALRAENQELHAAQAAGLEVLQAMIASPGDTQPVFDLIARQAAKLCQAPVSAVAMFDGAMLHLATQSGFDPDYAAFYASQFPRPATLSTAMGRAMLYRRVEQIENIETYPGYGFARTPGAWSTMAVPLLRDGAPLGVIGVTRKVTGTFPASHVTLLQTFAEQAVIAITSAETYRALQTRTSDLQEALEYQTATSDVLKVISRSTFDLQPVLETVVETATQLCNAEMALIGRRDGERWRVAANFGFPPEYETYERAHGAMAINPNSPSVGWRAVREQRVVHIHDVATIPDYHEASIRLAKQRTSLGVPLLRDGEAVGVIMLARRRVEPFTDRQIELVTTFADQAVIAIENTRLITETREALEQQTATAEVLQVINASLGDLAPVLDTILEKAMRLCDAAFGMFNTYDGTSFHTVVTRGVPAAFAAFRAIQSPTPTPGSPFGRAFETRRPVHIFDWLEEPGYKEGTTGGRAIADLGGARTVLNVPLVKDTTVLGMISFYRQQVRPFSDKQIALLENFAAQAVIAMENARLITEQCEALEQQTATAEVLQVINANPGDLTPVFDAILDKAHTLCGAVIGSLVLFDGTYFRAVATHGWPGSIATLFREPTGPNRARQSLVDGERFVQVADIRAIGHQPNSAWGDALVESTDARTMLLVPLRKDGALLGFISAFRPEVRAFSDKEITLLENFAAQAVIAMENVRLITETREALEQQTATAEVLQVINASPGDLTPVFDAVLEKAMRLCGAAFGSLYTYDGERFHSAAQRGEPSAYAAFRAENPPLPTPGGGPAILLETRRPFQVLDVRAHENHRPDYPSVRAMVELGGVRTILSVPLIKDTALLGFFSIYRQEVRAFSDRQIALLENFAAQAVIAMENARLITETREALEQQTATAEVLQVINSSPGDLKPVFDTLLEKAMRLCGGTIGGIYSYNGQGFATVALLGVTPAFQEYDEKYPMREVRPGSLPARMIETRGPVQNPDVLASETYRAASPYARALAELGGIRAVLNVPLLKEGALQGFIAIYRQEVGAFSDKQIVLLENFAAQAVIAMENARLLTETREALDQQTATAEVLQVINASPGDLSPVFDALLEKAMRLCEAAFGSLYTYDGARFHSAAQRGVPTAYAGLRERTPPSGQSGGPATRILKTKRTVHILDLMSEEAYQSGHTGIRALVELGGARTILGVPLLKDSTILGYISIYRQEVRAFSEKQIALLQSFAAQAVIAMENARLINETHEALEQQTATAEVLGVINSSPGYLGPVFDAILEKAHALCGAATGSLQLYDGEFLRAVATRGLPDEFANILRQPRRRLREALLRDAPFVQITDIADPVLAGGDKTLETAPGITGVRTLLWVPLRKDDALLGLIVAGRHEVRPFSQKEISLLQSFAAQAVIAMENARLLEEIRQRQAELRTTFDNMGDGVAMFDADLRLAAWNRNFQQIIDLPDALLRERPRYADYMRLLAERGEFGATGIEAELRQRIEDTDKELRLERVRPDGRVIEVRRNAVSGGGFVLIYSDITERKRSEEEIRAARDAAEAALRELRTAQANLIQAEKMASLGQLTAGIAHEIKNPLNFVNSFAALSVDLLGELKDAIAPAAPALTEKQRSEVEEVSVMLTSNLEKITEHGKRADGIVKAMLEHSRGSSGERRVVDLNALIDEALNLAYHGARAQDQSFNVTLERDFGEGIAPIEVNPQDITRVFLNIFSNGFYAANKRARSGEDSAFMPTLKVTTIDAGEAVEIRVRDNGTGIPVDIRDKLFQPFFTTKPTGEGTGLGLSITYDIVTKAHGGSIVVDSEVGEYSEFTIRLPRNP